MDPTRQRLWEYLRSVPRSPSYRGSHREGRQVLLEGEVGEDVDTLAPVHQKPGALADDLG